MRILCVARAWSRSDWRRSAVGRAERGLGGTVDVARFIGAGACREDLWQTCDGLSRVGASGRFLHLCSDRIACAVAHYNAFA